VTDPVCHHNSARQLVEFGVGLAGSSGFAFIHERNKAQSFQI
jgi:hypothetical protein